jgi:hypothetical protein
MFSFHHEPNVNGNQGEAGTPAEWRAAYEQVITRWQNRGVTLWSGSQDGETTTEGLMLCGPILVGGAYSGGNIHTNYDTFWPTNWTWGNTNLVASAMDGYNQGPVWRTFQEVQGGHPSRQGYKSWSDAKRITQNNAGRVHFQTIWETGTKERTAAPYSSNSAAWTATGLAATKANWIENMRDYIVSDWPDLFALTWFDSQGPNGAWLIDTSQASWDKWVEILQDPVFENGNDNQ